MNKKTCSLSLRVAITTVAFIGLSALLGQPLLSQTDNVPFDIEPDFVPCGWMGDAITSSVTLDENFVDNSRPDNQAIQITYQAGGSDGWAGIYWLPPDNRDCNWGRYPGLEIIGATKVTFWAKSEQDGELIEFKAGGVRGGGEHKDDFMASIRIPLTTAWEQYEIDISNERFDRVLGAFAWIARHSGDDDIVFYLDDIRYE